MRATWIVLAFSACHPAPAPVVPQDASDAAPFDSSLVTPDCSSACDTMAKLGCSGQQGNCAATLQKINDDRLIRTQSGGSTVNCGCIALARTPAAVVSCGVSCDQ